MYYYVCVLVPIKYARKVGLVKQQRATKAVHFCFKLGWIWKFINGYLTKNVFKVLEKIVKGFDRLGNTSMLVWCAIMSQVLPLALPTTCYYIELIGLVDLVSFALVSLLTLGPSHWLYPPIHPPTYSRLTRRSCKSFIIINMKLVVSRSTQAKRRNIGLEAKPKEDERSATLFRSSGSIYVVGGCLEL